MKKTTMTCLLFGLLIFFSFAVDVPSNLPKPDGTSGDTTKPLKVYILAGQSNMVGFGTLKNANPMYKYIYLSADPSIQPCRMPVGTTALLPHDLFQGLEVNSPKGARVLIYAGNYKPDTDYSSMKPLKETTIALGTVSKNLPSVPGPHTIVVKT